MSEFLDRISKLSPQRLALLADELNERVQEAEKRRRVPIAIVGIGCRLPGGVHDPEGFWNLLRDGVDAISEVPSSRWNAEEFYDSNPDTPGKMATRWGGFIEDPDRFDPKFFGIAPAEATSMDPQQRLLLETAWEALEHAGIAPSRLTGTATGVFVGICNGDYGQVALNASREAITAYFAPGLSHAVAAGRISYVLGLQGPSMAVDTSCSASLVAVHLACQSLRLEESDTALAGGVNLILNQDVTIALSQSKMMAPDGRCKAFSDSANGFVRSEGCGMIVLKRLPDAIRDGNRVLAVIRGSACNQDGRSSGLTAPNGPSQEAVVSSALSNAGMQPDEVDYIEAHGTGTSLGDPIEAGALNAVFASRSIKSEPLFVGSVKTNLGHLESAAGIAGLIKLVLSIQHGKIPASLHLKKPNSRIEWDRLPLKVPTRLETWNRRGEKRVGGISSFGFSGTNAHVVVEEYFDRTPSTEYRDHAFLFTLSAKTQSALEMMVRRLHGHLIDHPAVSLADVAHTLNEGRSHFEYRVAGTAGSHAELLALLSGARHNDFGTGIQTGRVIGHFPRMAFVFGGNGLHEANIGRELYDASPVFRESLQRCEQILGNDLEQPLTSVLYPEFPAGNQTRNGKSDLSARYWAAADFSLQYALAELWRACGIEPSVVWGYGIGEYVAACIAGVFSLEDGLSLAIAHGHESSDEFEERARRISYQNPRISLIPNSNAKGKVEVDSAEYWLRRSSEPAPLSSALSELTKEGSAANIYIGDSAGFQQFAKSIGNKLDGKWLPSLGKDESDCRQFMNAAASLYILGCELHMDGFYGNRAKAVSLPTYPFERERYWIESENRGRGADLNNLAANAVIDGTAHSTTDGDEWIYDLVWEPKPLKAASPRKEMCRWIVLADKFGIGSALKNLLNDSGRPCETIPCPHSATELEAVFCKLQDRLDNESKIEIVYLWGIDVSSSDISSDGSLSDLRQGAELCVKTPIDLLQIILKRKGNGARVWFGTRGSQAVGSFSPSIGGATQSMIWGVGRVLGLEAPEKYRALIDLDPTQTPEKAAASLLAELLTEDIEDQVAYRDGKRLVARLRNSRLEISTSKASTWRGLRADGSYLITGGLGGIGLRLAAWAAAQGAGHLVLLGRTGTGSNAGPFAAERLRAIAEIKARGTDVVVVEGDVASETDMKVLFGRFGEELPMLRGVIHAAAALNSAGLADLTDEQIEIMLRPKVLGTWVLHELTRSMKLDFFLAFSSAAALLGVKGMAHYAAANQFLDSFAHYRRTLGLPMLSVNWGAWDVMRLFSTKEQSRFGETGQLPMDSEQLFELIKQLVGSTRSQVMIANVDWDVLKPILEAKRVRPMLEGFGNRHPARTSADTLSIPPPASLHAAIGMAREGRRKFIEAFTLRQAAQVLGYRGGDLPPVDVPLTDIGLDSLMAVDLKNRLQTGLGQELSPTVVFDYPTVSGMVEMLETRLWAAHGNAEGELVSALKEEIRI